MGKGQQLYEHAKTIIPGGTQLLSKRPEQFLPDLWPAYYKKAKGCDVWDLDNNRYADVCFMGIGSCVLGYAQPDVNQAVIDAIHAGSMSTLNAPEEVALADKMLELHPWADMVRYAKAGGEAMAQAVRIARAASGKDKILFCGYHGWQDWYIAANLSEDDTLKEHLLSGLEPAGVPKGLAGSMIPFRYNDIDQFRKQCAAHAGEIAAVVMEPIRNDWPADGFLEEIRSYTAQHNIVLVLDEITAAFRLNCGGSHLALGIEPDMAVFGKALGNGFPISAIIGTQDVMQAAQDTFISSTFWTERTGFAAALATIQYYEQHAVEEHLEHMGKQVKQSWQQAASKHNVPISVGGIHPLANFAFQTEQPLVYKTYYIQEMLKLGFLASTAFYASYAHTDDIIGQYALAMDQVFGQMEQAEDVQALLDGPVCHSGFQRLI